MDRRHWIAPLVCGAVLAATGETVRAQEPPPPPWGYGAADGPDRWASLTPLWKVCGTGRRQSPVALRKAERAEPPPLELSYRELPAVVRNNGHTVEAEFPPGAEIRLGKRTYELEQLHFHAPAEHPIDGRRGPLEMHVVHRDGPARLAVLGVPVRSGPAHPAFQPLLDAMPPAPGPDGVPLALDPAALLPPGRAEAARFRYPGSLTTPPCAEIVDWNVFAKPVTLSKAQIARFTSLYEGNARPVQGLDGRKIRRG